MGKAPSFQFYPSDWMRDLTEHPLEIEGAWIRICCALFWSETRGTSDKNLTKWARILRVGERKCLTIIAYLDNHNIADVIKQNESIRITSRRMVKDEYIRKVRSFAGSQGGNPGLKNKAENTDLDKQPLNKLKRPSSSSSSSSSSLEPKIKSIVEKSTRRFLPPTLTEVSYYCTQRNSKVDPQKFLDYYESNGWRVGKNPMKSWQAAIRTWERNDYGGGNGLQNSSGGGRTESARDKRVREAREESRRILGLRGSGDGVPSTVHADRDAAGRSSKVGTEVIEGSCLEIKKT
jgi:hypothetical protein